MYVNYGWIRGAGGGIMSLLYSALQWLHQGTAPATVDDKTANELDDDYVDSNCATFDGTAYLAVSELVGTETVTSSGGTSTPSISAGRIDFTAGTCWNLVLSNGSVYPMGEGSGGTCYDVENEYHGTLTSYTDALVWADVQSSYHHNTFNGHSKTIDLATSLSNVVLPSTVPLVGDFTTTWVINPEGSTAANPLLFGDTNGASGVTIRIGAANEYTVKLAFTLYTNNTSSEELFDGNFHTLIVARSGSTFTFTVDGVLKDSITATTATINVDHAFSRNAAAVDSLNGKLSSFTLGGVTYATRDAFGTSLVGDDESVATIAGGTALYYPALASGTNDVKNLGLTNPGITGNQIHNNSETLVQQSDYNLIGILASGGCECLMTYDTPQGGKPSWASGDGALLWDTLYWKYEDYITGESWHWSTSYTGTFPPVGAASGAGDLGSAPVTLSYNEFWVDDAEWTAKSFADLRANLNFEDNVIVCSTASSIIAAWTWAQDYLWTPENYEKMINYLANRGCTGTSLEPLLDDSDDYILDDDGYIIFAD